MKNLELNQMEDIQGGDFAGAFCAGAAIAMFFAPNPVLVVVNVGCIAYGLFT